MARPNRRRTAFTLIEIMSVIVIMGIIAALLLVAAKGARVKAQIEAAKADIAFIASKIDAYREKRDQLPPNLHPALAATTSELDIYKTLSDWGFAVPDKKQVDPWGNPYIIVLQRDYGQNFLLITRPAGSGYEDEIPVGTLNPFSKIRNMYHPLPAADAPKEVCAGDPASTLPFLDQPDAFQVISAGPDGLLSRDNRELSADIDGDNLTVNADNLTNW